MRDLSTNEMAEISGGNITWGDIGAAAGAILGGSVGGGIIGGAIGGLAGKAVGEYFGCESTVNACQKDNVMSKALHSLNHVNLTM